MTTISAKIEDYDKSVFESIINSLGLNVSTAITAFVKATIRENGLLEHAEYVGNYYGTPRAYVEKMQEEGKDVLLEIDVQGAFQVRDRLPEAHLVFIEPPSFEELERRLRGRGTESEERIQKRLAAAKVELSRKEEYDIRLVNDDLDVAVQELVDYVNEKAEEIRG